MVAAGLLHSMLVDSKLDAQLKNEANKFTGNNICRECWHQLLWQVLLTVQGVDSMFCGSQDTVTTVEAKCLQLTFVEVDKLFQESV